MENWYLLSLVGKDRPGLVAQVSAALCKAGCNLGDSSMARLGNNFTILLMVQPPGNRSHTATHSRALVVSDTMTRTLSTPPIDTSRGRL